MPIVVIQLLNYTLSFLMWMIVGRVILTLISGGRQTVFTGLFVKATEPVYRVGRKVFAFAAVPPEKQGTSWASIEGCLPFYLVFIIFVLRLALILMFVDAPPVQG